MSGGLSYLGLRFASDGALPWADIRWLAAARTASVEVVRIGLPYSFYDLNFALQAHPSEDHRVRLSFFASEDEFAWEVFETRRASTLDVGWANLVSSLSWSWVGSDRVTSEATAYFSRYRGRQQLGGSTTSPVTRSGISAAGVRARIALKGDRTGARVGLSLEGGPVDLEGSGSGGFVTGDASRSYMHASVFAEAERYAGPFRITPGIRAGVETQASRSFVEPRLSVRFQTPVFAVSASLDRTYQFLSVLRDNYAAGPSAPAWFLRAPEQSASRADGASLSFDSWRGEEWTGSVAVWARRFTSIPHWRPTRSRDLSEIEFHDGRGRGVEVTLRKHGGRVRGWISYQWSRTSFTDTLGSAYLPRWDRRHEAEGTLTLDVTNDLVVSIRGNVSSGTPFWFPLSDQRLLGYGSLQRKESEGGYWYGRDALYTLWSDKQGRMPLYARYDASVRYTFRWGKWRIEPFVSAANLFDRRNVLAYDFPALHGGGAPGDTPPEEQTPRLSYRRQLPRLPFFGINIRF